MVFAFILKVYFFKNINIFLSKDGINVFNFFLNKFFEKKILK